MQVMQALGEQRKRLVLRFEIRQAVCYPRRLEKAPCVQGSK